MEKLKRNCIDCSKEIKISQSPIVRATRLRCCSCNQINSKKLIRAAKTNREKRKQVKMEFYNNAFYLRG